MIRTPALDSNRVATRTALALACAVVVHCGRSAPTPDPEEELAPSLGEELMALGSVTSPRAVVCPAGGAAGATCERVTVTCPNASPPLGVTIAITRAPALHRGTVLLHGGGGGTLYWDGGFVSAYRAAGFDVVQILWDSDWEDTAEGHIKQAACRPATMVHFLWSHVHHGDRQRGYCAQGFSGGAAAFSYALAHYGRESELDYVSLISGPPFGRLDYGCDPTLFSPSGTKNVCGVAVQLGYAGPEPVDGWENTSTCLGTPSGADLSRWSSDSVVSAGADYVYPSTPVELAVCRINPAPAMGLGSFYYDRITSTKSLLCAAGGCSGERVMNDPSAFATLKANMEARCKPSR